MLQSDVNRRCAVYDRPIGEGNGVVGKIIFVYDSYRFRLRTDNGFEHEINTSPRTDGTFTPWVKFIDNQEVRQ
jgi:hypothetical protein